MTDKIAQADASIVVTPYSVTYDGNAHSATGTVTVVAYVQRSFSETVTCDDGHAEQVVVTDTTEVPENIGGLTITSTHTEAGTYHDYWTVVDPDGNYAPQAGMMTDKIAKATATVKIIPYNSTYNGALHAASGVAYGVGGRILAGLNLGGTAHVSAGTYRDAWCFTDTTGNYTNTSGMITDVIGKANAKIWVGSYNAFFNGGAHIASGVAVGVYGQLLPGLNLGGTVHLGGYNTTYFYDRWSFTDTTGNYNSTSGVAVDVIRGNQALYRAMYHPFYPRSVFYGRLFMW